MMGTLDSPSGDGCIVSYDTHLFTEVQVSENPYKLFRGPEYSRFLKFRGQLVATFTSVLSFLTPSNCNVNYWADLSLWSTQTIDSISSDLTFRLLHFRKRAADVLRYESVCPRTSELISGGGLFDKRWIWQWAQSNSELRFITIVTIEVSFQQCNVRGGNEILSYGCLLRKSYCRRIQSEFSQPYCPSEFVRSHHLIYSFCSVS